MFMKTIHKIQAKINEAAANNSKELDLSGIALTERQLAIIIAILLDKIPEIAALRLSDCELTYIPPTIGNLNSLKNLFLQNNKLRKLPDSLGRLPSLINLNVSHNRLSALPETIGNLKCLQVLVVAHNKLTSLPESIGKLNWLYVLRANNNKLSRLPKAFKSLAGLSALDLSYNPQLQTIAKDLQYMEYLVRLYINGNNLTVLPMGVNNFTRLQQLHASGNNFSSLPEYMRDLNKLSVLNLEGSIQNLDVNSIAVLQDLYENNPQLHFEGVDIKNLIHNNAGAATEKEVPGVMFHQLRRFAGFGAFSNYAYNIQKANLAQGQGTS